MTTTTDVLQTIRQAVLDVLDDMPVVIDNSPVPDYQTPWARVVTTVDSAVVVTEPDRYRWSGSVSVSIYAPREKGDATVLAECNALVAAMRTWRDGSPMMRVTSASLVGSSDFGDGWSGRTVRIAWTADVPA